MPRIAFRATLLCCPFALAACGHGAPTTEIRERDSAGIMIIEHSEGAVAAAPRWTLGDPAVTITNGGGEDEGFSYIGGARRLPDGRIVLADNENEGTRFFVYGADGKFERRIGRAGEGPGEYRNAMLIGASGDTLTIYDLMSARATRVTAEGALVGTQELARFGNLKIGVPDGVLADGRLIATPIPFGDTAGSGAPRYRQRVPVELIDGSADRMDTLATGIPGNEVYPMQMNFGGTTRTFPAAVGYGKRTFFDVGADRVHVVTNARADVVTYRLPWAVARIVRLALPVRVVDAAARQAQIDAAIANAGQISGTPPAMMSAFIDNIRRATFADSMAPFNGMLLGADGALWLKEMRSVADSVPHYLVVGADGHLAGRIDLPLAARLLWSDGTQALIGMKDENDVPRLELRPVTKGTTAN